MRHEIQLLAVGAMVLGAVTGCTDVSTNANGQRLKLLANDGAERDFFGGFVAISGTTAIIGAVDVKPDLGSAYLFDTTSGRQIAKLLPNDDTVRDGFGFSVGISGATAIVGARGNVVGEGAGAVYLFDTTTGQQVAKLLADDGAALNQFGCSVAISSATAIVGDPGDDDDSGIFSGSVYVFDVSDPANAMQIAKFRPNDRAANDGFSRSLAISGTTAIVGVPWDDDNGEQSGSAYLLDISDPANPKQIAKFLSGDGTSGDWFGQSVAISGTIAIVGAPFDGDNGELSGAAYLFDTVTGQQIAKLLPHDGAEQDTFGDSVSINGTIALVAAKNSAANGSYSGAVYLFDTITGQEIAKLLPNDGARAALFGWSVAIGSTTAIVGAPQAENDHGLFSGVAYVFDITRR